MFTYIVPYVPAVTRHARTAIKSHAPAVLWFTGLPASGKSTLANAVEVRLNQEWCAHTYLLDGDNLRAGLNSDLAFTPAARTENIRRAGEVARLFYDAGLIVLTAFISPLRADRDRVRAHLPANAFVEIHVDCPLAVCEQRDPKGLYQKARRGELRDFTGVDAPYEPSVQPELTLNTASQDVTACVETVLRWLSAAGLRRTI